MDLLLVVFVSCVAFTAGVVVGLLLTMIAMDLEFVRKRLSEEDTA